MNYEKTRILAQLQAIRENRPSHFWAGTLVAGVSLFGMVAAFGTAPESAQIRDYQRTVVEQIPLALDTFQVTGHSAFVREERIQHGDTVAALLSRLGVQDGQAFAFLRQKPETQRLCRQLRPGKVVSAQTNESGELLALTFPLNGTKDNALVVEKRDGRLQASEQGHALTPQVVMKSGEIRSSLFAATDAIGLPDGIAIQMSEVLGGDIDFHRDLRRGDRFSVVYEVLYNQGQPARTGRILAAEFVNDGVTRRTVWFDGGHGVSGYYTPEGQSLKKAFLRSPLEFSRISSGFSMRFHPILRKWRAHKGVDYAAPIGTNVRATADGVVEFVGQQRGYGKFVVLRHHDRYTTAYGHLNGFASGLRQGSRVEQGEVIGYVGRTGWATGPHLHYEFRIADVHQDPLSVALPISIPLSGVQLGAFRSETEPLLARIALMGSAKIARAE